MNRIVAATTAMALLCLAATAAAERPFTEQKAQVSAHVGVGFPFDELERPWGDVNPYGFGLGARGGYTFNPNIYFGGLFEFYFGEEEDQRLAILDTSSSANLWLLQGEVGYDFGVSRAIVLRPKFSIGMAQVSTEDCERATVPFGLGGSTCNDDSDGEFSAGLGLEVPIDLGGLYFAPEARFNFGDDISAILFALGVGAAF